MNHISPRNRASRKPSIRTLENYLHWGRPFADDILWCSSKLFSLVPPTWAAIISGFICILVTVCFLKSFYILNAVHVPFPFLFTICGYCSWLPNLQDASRTFLLAYLWLLLHPWWCWAMELVVFLHFYILIALSLFISTLQNELGPSLCLLPSLFSHHLVLHCSW